MMLSNHGLDSDARETGAHQAGRWAAAAIMKARNDDEAILDGTGSFGGVVDRLRVTTKRQQLNHADAADRADRKAACRNISGGDGESVPRDDEPHDESTSWRAR